MFHYEAFWVVLKKYPRGFEAPLDCPEEKSQGLRDGVAGRGLRTEFRDGFLARGLKVSAWLVFQAEYYGFRMGFRTRFCNRVLS